MGGLNSAFGNAIICLGFCWLLAGLLWSHAPAMRFWRRAWPALAIILAAAIWAAIGLSAGRPVAPDLAYSGFMGLFGNVAALLCGAAMSARRIPLSRFCDWLLLLGCIGLMLALIAQGNGDAVTIISSVDHAGRFLGTLDNANAAGATYGALAALALARALETFATVWADDEPLFARLKAAAYWIALILLVGGCLLTASRSGATLMVLALGGVGLRAAPASHARRTMGFLGVGLVVLLILGIGYADILQERFGRLPHDVSLRMLLWQHNWGVAWQSPLFGYGLGGFTEINARYLGTIRDAQAIWMTNAPHNIMLKLMIEGGLPFFLLILAAGLTIIGQIIVARHERPLDLDATAIAMAILVLLGSASVDIALEVPALAALGMVWMGLLWGRAISRRQ
jgi:O-antigen ligase